eukprot:TRINITY_DN1293_c0_g1_i1.p2 TRINITY_DN1293_c0_g1~~TRINITY_DN1293_c0_g1_i1.p2  ORF type:complete len:146 (-),score=33.51 TRINITY_DN1293_c0_g1_i1:127-564(-)
MLLARCFRGVTPAARSCLPAAALGRSAQVRRFSEYEGQNVSDAQLVKQADDWVIEETNFCLGRVSFPRFKETDDLARRTQHLMDCQLAKQHTRLRDGTVIPYTVLFLDDILDKPGPAHIFTEQPLLKWTWDETYDEAYEKPDSAK